MALLFIKTSAGSWDVDGWEAEGASSILCGIDP